MAVLKKALLMLFTSALAAVLMVALLFAWFNYRAMQQQIILLPDQMTLVQGEGNLQTDIVTINAWSEQGIALLSSIKGLTIQAQQFSHLHWCLSNSSVTEGVGLHLLWRRADTGSVLNTTLPVRAGCSDYALADVGNWSGLISGLAIQLSRSSTASEKLSNAIELTQLSLQSQPPPLLEISQQLWQQWREPHSWRASSLHFIQLGAFKPTVALPLVLMCWALLTALLLWFIKPRKTSLLSGVIISFVVVWLLMDAFWQWDVLRRVDESHTLLADKSMSERLRQYDGDLVDFLDQFQTLAPAKHIFLISDESFRTRRIRTHYHLLPNNVFSYSDLPPTSELAEVGDYVIVMGRLKQIRYHARRRQEMLLWGANNEHRLAVEPILAEAGMAVFKVRAMP